MAAYFHSTLSAFLTEDAEKILGQLLMGSHNSGFAELQLKQAKAWKKEIVVLKRALSEVSLKVTDTADWGVLLEYPIPRRQKRIDAVILARDVVFCIEFKTEDKSFSLNAQRQVEDYGLDLRDFHERSRCRVIVPILVAFRAESSSGAKFAQGEDCVKAVVCTNAVEFGPSLIAAYQAVHNPSAPPISPTAWDTSPYRPVPTIIEAAEALFAGHNVREIAHSHAGAQNLTLTSNKLVEIIQRAQKLKQKVICFVTGVPGAGKTLAGLNVVHNPALRQEGRPPGVFLSGNGPLVKIVSAAIAKDSKRRQQAAGAERKTSAFVQNVHAFVKEALEKSDRPPPENIIVFDEAQRAWDAAHNTKKTGQEQSEPEVMLSIMDRQPDWAVIVALVGGGQEIHNGEAGLAEWGRSLAEKFDHWQVAVSPQALAGGTSVAGKKLFEHGGGHALVVQKEPCLHLEVNLRSFRAQKLAEWVEAVLGLDAEKAADIFPSLNEFPLVLTRSLNTARTWLLQRARGLRRCGLVASSGAVRLRADGLELSSGFRQGNRDLYVHWFLAEPPDVRSSNQLEVAASEFECQGLELDWVGACWGGDLTSDIISRKWVFQNFSGSRWGAMNKEIDQQYLLNTYRVLLTRARQGLILWIPPGDTGDRTRLPETFDATADYLASCGVPLI